MPWISKKSPFTSMICSRSFHTWALRSVRSSQRLRFKNSSAAFKSPEGNSYSALGTDMTDGQMVGLSGGGRQKPPNHPTTSSSTKTCQLLQQMPILQPILLRVQQRLRRVAVLVELLGEPAFAAGEVDERHLLVRLRIDVPVAFDVRVAL